MYVNVIVRARSAILHEARCEAPVLRLRSHQRLRESVNVHLRVRSAVQLAARGEAPLSVCAAISACKMRQCGFTR